MKIYRASCARNTPTASPGASRGDGSCEILWVSRLTTMSYPCLTCPRLSRLIFSGLTRSLGWRNKAIPKEGSKSSSHGGHSFIRVALRVGRRNIQPSVRKDIDSLCERGQKTLVQQFAIVFQSIPIIVQRTAPGKVQGKSGAEASDDQRQPVLSRRRFESPHDGFPDAPGVFECPAVITRKLLDRRCGRR